MKIALKLIKLRKQFCFNLIYLFTLFTGGVGPQKLFIKRKSDKVTHSSRERSLKILLSSLKLSESNTFYPLISLATWRNP